MKMRFAFFLALLVVSAYSFPYNLDEDGTEEETEEPSTTTKRTTTTTTTATTPKSRFDITEEVEKLLAKLKPSDPHKIQFHNQTFDMTELKGYMNMENITITGFSDVDVGSASLSITKFKLEMTLKELLATYNYDGDAVFYGFIPMYGKGTVKLVLNNAKFGIISDVEMKTADDPLSIRNTTLDVALEKFDVEITGLLDNPELGTIAQEVLHDFVMNILEKKELINSKFTPVFEKFTNDLLVENNITPKVILGE